MWKRPYGQQPAPTTTSPTNLIIKKLVERQIRLRLAWVRPQCASHFSLVIDFERNLGCTIDIIEQLCYLGVMVLESPSGSFKSDMNASNWKKAIWNGLSHHDSG